MNLYILEIEQYGLILAFVLCHKKTYCSIMNQPIFMACFTREIPNSVLNLSN